jgi:predicted AlkP superfamily pyrophosphatase or phosphodiesterase
MPVRPAYAAAGLSNLVPALLGMRDADWLPPCVSGATTVVLIALDGLGWDAIQERRDELPELGALEGGPITTVVPSTTATALTSLTTGLEPGRHGVLGYRVRIDGSVLNMLTWQSEARHAPDALDVQRHAPFLGREVPVVTKAEFRRTAFTDVHLRGTRFLGWHTLSALVEQCRRLAEDREPFVYGYYPGIDTVAHAHGLHDGFYDVEIRAVDRLVGDLRAALPPECALVVTSDHGQVHVGPEGWLPLRPIIDLVDACSGDGRFRYLHARRGGGADLLAAARSEFGDLAWVLSREELIDDGWLGPEVTPVARRRLGDVVLAAKGSVAFVDPELEREARIVSAHGSLTASEMLVPLLAGRGRRG